MASSSDDVNHTEKITVPADRFLTLSWSVQNANGVFLDGTAQPLTGQFSLGPEEVYDHTYELEVLALDGRTLTYYMEVTVDGGDQSDVHGPNLTISCQVEYHQGTQVLVTLQLRNIGDEGTDLRYDWYPLASEGQAIFSAIMFLGAGEEVSILPMSYDYGQSGTMHWKASIKTQPEGLDVEHQQQLGQRHGDGAAVRSAPSELRDTAACSTVREFAPGVYQLMVGQGLLRANVYFLRADGGERGGSRRGGGASRSDGASPAWVLIDTGVPGSDKQIRAAAEGLFGAGAAPTAILITHAHPDHVGSAAELARCWQCPVYMHHQEVRMIGADLDHFRRHSFTLDRWLILPLLRLAGKRHIQAIAARGGLHEYARPLDASAATIPVPGLPDWEAIPTPGHTPGHVALFREKDRVLISGDAVVTKAEPFSAILGKRATLSRSPWYFSWNLGQARHSLMTLAELEPLVIAGGHGSPRKGTDFGARLRALAAGR